MTKYDQAGVNTLFTILIFPNTNFFVTWLLQFSFYLNNLNYYVMGANSFKNLKQYLKLRLF